MNLTSFLKQTDAITAQYSTAQLIAFIHNIARTLPKYGREDFLKRLNAVGEETGRTEKTADKEKTNAFEFDEMYQLVRDHLKTIDSQEVSINGILNTEYDEWYDEEEPEVYYEDCDGISDMLAEACDFLHTCIDMKRYKEGFEIGDQMLSMEILCTNEYDDEEISFADMVHYELLQCDLRRVFLDIAYCAYYAMPLEKQPEALYRVIINAGKEELTLEAIMQHGEEELQNFQKFLTCWIKYLGDKAGHNAERLILEAVGLCNDVSLAVKYAEKYAAVHPGLYWDLLANKNDTDVKNMISIGIAAMKTIPRKYIIRSKVALKTAEYIIEANENLSLLETCYFTAYESDTSALNYIRALFHGFGTEQKREELRNVFAAISVNKKENFSVAFSRTGLPSEQQENKPDSNMIWILWFLDGQFLEVLANGLNKQEALGWSGTFMKQGIALYLLCLYEGEWAGKGIRAMASAVKKAMNFSAEEYWKGTRESSDASEDDLFYSIFSRWKSMTPMNSEVKDGVIKKITGLLEKRTGGIMDANRRNYYGECAAYIAALGEVLESLGETGAKQRFMTSYQNRYSRRSAFREELRRYGWIDVKRK